MYYILLICSTQSPSALQTNKTTYEIQYVAQFVSESNRYLYKKELIGKETIYNQQQVIQYFYNNILNTVNFK